MKVVCFALLLCINLTACGFFGPCGHGDPFALFQYCPKTKSYPYGARFVKEGMTRESRLADWVGCSGDSALGYNVVRKDIFDKEYFPQVEKQADKLFLCMKAKGYVYQNPYTAAAPEQCNPQKCLYP
jgi:hypothetical protein